MNGKIALRAVSVVAGIAALLFGLADILVWIGGSGPFEVGLIEIAGDAEAQPSSHEGEEFIVVVSGEVELAYGGETRVLKPGDSAYYNSVVRHLVKAANGQPATIYAAVFMPF